ncbi:MAG: SIS domain-containing protein [Actinobacteria bacterium]|nr:SIS domain-containing protein [Actinomycetota bacterium]
MGSEFGVIMRSEIEEIPSVFKRIRASAEEMTSQIHMLPLSNIDSVILVARGTSDNAALYLKYLIETKLGIPCGLASPSVVSIYGTTLRFKNVLVIALSQSGQSPDLIGYCQAARDGGATVLAMTNDSASPLARISHCHLYLQAGPERAVAATKSYSAELLVARTFVSAWSGESINFDPIIEQTQKVLELTSEIEDIASRFNYHNGVTTMGRGYAYANAQECALKIQETLKIPVASFSSADYLHGPISSLHEDSHVVFLAPFGIAEAAMSATVQRIREITKHIYWIGAGFARKPDEIYLGGAIDLSEVDAVIVDSVILQLFALFLAVSAGKNPDAPVGLLKVTKTV